LATTNIGKTKHSSSKSLIMAVFYKGGNSILSTTALGQADQFALNYWGSVAAERIFPIAYWKVQQMIAASNSKQIALRITNIDAPNVLDGFWMPFEDSLTDSLGDPYEPGVSYFIMEDSSFYGPFPIKAPNDTIKLIKGMLNVTVTPHNAIIRGRIGKDDQTGRVFAFFQAAECTIIGIGGGGQGTSTGFKIPSP
jgi:hypothetical protein